MAEAGAYSVYTWHYTFSKNFMAHYSHSCGTASNGPLNLVTKQRQSSYLDNTLKHHKEREGQRYSNKRTIYVQLNDHNILNSNGRYALDS